MKTVIVKNQAEWDKLPAKFDEWTIIEIRSNADTWVTIRSVPESSRVVARESSSVVARGSSRVEAWGSVAVHVQNDSVTATLFAFAVAFAHAKGKITKKSKTATIIRPTVKAGVPGWLENQGIDNKAKVILFKRVSKDWKTQEGTSNETIWMPGTMLTHSAWEPESGECGEGKFHACSTAYFCDDFRDKPDDRYVEIEIAQKDLHAWPNPQYPHKIAFRAGKVLHEVDKWGDKKGGVK